ncbi:MAG: helix-turn-helix domain-containing protein [Cyclobacteriaceae bacterium]
MAANIITPEDLQAFKQELLEEIKSLLSNRPATTRKWLKSHEVRRLLTISPGTLQNLRVNGTLPFTKIGGVIFYDYEDIRKMLQDNKNTSEPPTKKHKPSKNG